MDESRFDTNLPALTRLVRASALLAAQGAAMGFAGNTLRLWDRLSEFVSNNRISAIERKSILLWLVVPMMLWVASSLLWSVVRVRSARRLEFLERIAHRGSWIVAVGLIPVLVHPTLWRTRVLMFLIATGAVTLATWWAVRLTLGAGHLAGESTFESQIGRIVAYLDLRTPALVKVLAPIFVIGAVVAYIVLRGVWLDPTAVPKTPALSFIGVHSIQQAFRVMGHAGWLGIPVAALQFLRPPGHAHVFFWAACVSCAAFPLYLWARPHLGRRVALLLALAYLAMPALRTIGRAEVLPLGTAAGVFFYACLQWERGNLRRALVATVLTIGLHEQAALWFTCLGLYLAVSESRTEGRWLAGLSIAYFAFVALLWLPRLDVESYRESFKGLWGIKPVGLVETLRVTVTNPAYVLSRWIDVQDLTFWLSMLVPFAFLPIVGRDWVMWMLPGALFAIVAFGRAPALPVSHSGFAHLIVLGFAASLVTLKRLRAAESTRDHAAAAIAAWAMAVASCSYQLGGLWAPAP